MKARQSTCSTVFFESTGAIIDFALTYFKYLVSLYSPRE
jgi:hypothetical protein